MSEWAVLSHTISQYCTVSLLSCFHFLDAIGSDLIRVLLLLFCIPHIVCYEHSRVLNCASSFNVRSNALDRKRIEIRKLHENSSIVCDALVRLRPIYQIFFEQFLWRLFMENCSIFTHIKVNFLNTFEFFLKRVFFFF